MEKQNIKRTSIVDVFGNSVMTDRPTFQRGNSITISVKTKRTSLPERVVLSPPVEKRFSVQINLNLEIHDVKEKHDEEKDVANIKDDDSKLMETHQRVLGSGDSSNIVNENLVSSNNP